MPPARKSSRVVSTPVPLGKGSPCHSFPLPPNQMRAQSLTKLKKNSLLKENKTNRMVKSPKTSPTLSSHPQNQKVITKRSIPMGDKRPKSLKHIILLFHKAMSLPVLCGKVFDPRRNFWQFIIRKIKVVLVGKRKVVKIS